MECMRRRAGCSGKYRKLPRTCLVPDPVVLVFVCWPPNAPNWSAAWPPARVRFITPVRVCTRIRAHARLLSVDEIEPNVFQQVNEITVEIESESKPAMVAES